MTNGATMRIGDLAARAGVSVSTLRAWEDRYGVLAPERTAGGHRLYGEEDLARIEAVHALVAAGHTVAAAAAAVGAGTGERGFTLGTMQAELDALRAIARADRPAQVRDALRRFVESVGGSTVAGTDAGDDALPVDVSVGDGPPRLPVAPNPSVARLELERALPALVEDARLAVARLRQLERRAARGR